MTANAERWTHEIAVYAVSHVDTRTDHTVADRRRSVGGLHEFRRRGQFLRRR